MDPPPPPKDDATSSSSAGGGGGRSPQVISDAIERDVRPWLDLVEALRREGVQEDLPLPQIAVMGDQSSGKSSVLEALSGIQFPRGSGLVTRCPIQLTMTKAPPGSPWRAKAFIQWATKRRPEEPKDIVDVTSSESLTQVISTMMDTVTGADPHKLSSDTIMVELSSPELPDLTLIDLPGIVRTFTAGQSEHVIRDVNHLIQEYLNQERTVILAVVPANQDISTIDILERAHRVDPEGNRTIGVLTKPDLINPGGESEVLAVARNIRKPLKLGYIMVKNRTQHELNQRVHLAEAQAHELDFFCQHPHFKALPPNQIGIKALASKLTRVLVSRIQTNLPYMKHELNEKLERARKELEAYGDPAPTEPWQARSAAMHIVTKYCKMLRESIRGDYREATFTTRKSMRIRMLTDIAFRNVQSAVLSTRPDFQSEEFSENLSKEVMALRGRELPGFSNSMFFRGFMAQYVEKWRSMVDTHRAALVEAVKMACIELMEVAAPAYPRFSSIATDVVAEVFRNVEMGLESTLEDVFKREQDPFTVNDDLVIAVDRVRFTRFDDVCNQVLKDVKKDPNFLEGIPAIREFMLNHLGGWYMTNHGADFHAKVGDQRTVLHAYFNVCSRRVMDNVCMVMEDKLLQAVAEAVEMDLVNTLQGQADASITELFMEDPTIKERRLQLQGQISRLEAALAHINRVVPGCVTKSKACPSPPSPSTTKVIPVDAPSTPPPPSSATLRHTPSYSPTSVQNDRQVEGLGAGGGGHDYDGKSTSTKSNCLAVFTYRHTGDNGGYICWLGTAGKTRPFKNPQDEGKIRVTSSGMPPGMSEAILVSRKRTPCWTEDSHDTHTWIGIDFGANRLFSLTHYALCNGSPEPGFDLCGWAVEGYHEANRSWVMLDPPHPSKVLPSPYGVTTFRLPSTTKPDQRFRRLRLRNCQPNSRGTNSIPICAIELYGTLYEA